MVATAKTWRGRSGNDYRAQRAVVDGRRIDGGAGDLSADLRIVTEHRIDFGSIRAVAVARTFRKRTNRRGGRLIGARLIGGRDQDARHRQPKPTRNRMLLQRPAVSVRSSLRSVGAPAFASR